MKITDHSFSYGNPTVPFKLKNLLTEATDNLHELTEMEKRLEYLKIPSATYLVEYVDLRKRNPIYAPNGTKCGYEFGKSYGFVIVTGDEAEKYFAVDDRPSVQTMEDESEGSGEFF